MKTLAPVWAALLSLPLPVEAQDAKPADAPPARRPTIPELRKSLDEKFGQIERERDRGLFAAIASYYSPTERGLSPVKRAAAPNKVVPTEAQVLLAMSKGLGDLTRQLVTLEGARQYDRAIPVARKVHALCVDVFGEQADISCDVLYLTGMFQFCLHAFDEADEVFRRVEKAQAASLGEAHPKYLATINMLATVQRLASRYEEAERHWLKLLALERRAFGDREAALAETLDDLASMYRDLGDHGKAESYYRQALAVRERALGPDHAETLITLTDLARTALAQGKDEEARPLVERLDRAAEQVLARAERAADPDQTEADLPLLIALGRTKTSRGDLRGAERLLTAALAACGRSASRDRSDTECLFSLGVVCHLRGDHAAALRHLLRCQFQVEKDLGRDHPAKAPFLDEVGAIWLEVGNRAKALQCRQEAWRLLERERARVSDYATETEQAAFAQNLAGTFHVNLALAVERLAGDSAARAFGLDLVLSSKGSILEALARRQRDVFRGADPELRRRHAEWRTACALYYEASMSRPDRRDQTRHQEVLAALERRKDDAEQALARASAPFALQRQARLVKRQDVAGALPAGSALVEVVKYHSFLPREFTPQEKARFVERVAETLNLRPGGGQRPAPANPPPPPPAPADGPPPAWKYVAFVLCRDEKGTEPTLQVVPLGAADRLEAAVHAWRRAVLAAATPGSEAEGRAAEQAAQDLMEFAWKPLARAIGPIRKVYLSPDGALSFVSFAALPGAERGRFLIEDYDITYLTTGRDLVGAAPDAEAGAPVLLGAPDYGRPGADLPRPPAAGPGGGSPVPTDVVRGLGDGRPFRGFAFGPLEETEKEVTAVAELLRARRLQPVVWTGSRANEGALRAVRRPALLHFATHAFFLTDTGLDELLSSGRGVGGTRPGVPQDGGTADQYLMRLLRLKNPMHRSGIALSGANDTIFGRRAAGGDDGILTAEEVAGLDLVGTNLVVVSACESGVGEARRGEGVFGLRRAFALAGARHLVLSLWPVSDEHTRLIMESFYAHLAREGNPPRALLAAQRAWIARQRAAGRYLHPFYWAAFVASGAGPSLERP